jgi:beta-glucosidase
VTILDAFRERFSGKLSYARGAAIVGNDDSLQTAVDYVSQSDLAIVVIGDRPEFTGERKSTATLELQGGQKQLLAEILKTGKDFVLVVISSKPLVLDQSVVDAASAIIWQFSPGMLGGLAAARAIFGDFNPSGRLPISIPRHVGQLPVYYQPYAGTHGSEYADCPFEPRWSFGYGLGYSGVTYDGASIDGTVFKISDEIKVTIKLRNTGNRDAVEVVQVYVSDLLTSVTWVNQELKGFARVKIPAGESLTVQISIKAADLSIVDANAVRVVEPGDFELRIGKASNNIQFVIPFTIA